MAIADFIEHFLQVVRGEADRRWRPKFEVSREDGSRDGVGTVDVGAPVPEGVQEDDYTKDVRQIGFRAPREIDGHVFDAQLANHQSFLSDFA